MTLWEVMSSALVSDPTVWVADRLLSGLLAGAVEVELSEESRGTAEAGDWWRSVLCAIDGTDGDASAIDGDNGSRSFFSLMLRTIFSKPSDVMCFSVPLLRLSIESCLRTRGLRMFRGAVCGLACSSIRSSTSDATESTLADNSGISLDFGRELTTLMAGVVANCGCASQQKVSRFHNLQLRFSNLRPSSIDSAHLENTAREKSGSSVKVR